MPARNPLAVDRLPHADTPAEKVEPPLDPAPAAARQGRTNCGSCGKAWFGDVAYCPYCGRSSASAATATGAETPPAAGPRAASAPAENVRPPARRLRLFLAPEGVRAGRQGMRWMARWMAIIASATALVLAGIAVQDFAERASVKAGSPAARRTPAAGATDKPASAASARVAAPRPAAASAPGPAPAPAATQAVPAAVAPAVAPQAPASAPPARNRSLCSAANEAAGLCNAQ